MKQLKDLFAKYAPGKDVTYSALRAFQSWLLFAKSAASCGDQLTRKCVYDNAIKESAWTGGGLQAPVDQSPTGAKSTCFNIVQATATPAGVAGRGLQTRKGSVPLRHDPVHVQGRLRQGDHPRRFREEHERLQVIGAVPRHRNRPPRQIVTQWAVLVRIYWL
ncbi:hypothetical protein [Nocardia sp. NPDC049526]|uniref:hypothetical protein n=1 Tax=Nocardia sp. NPDC049526 TaxID=3364316 RepID=UPI00378D5245